MGVPFAITGGSLLAVAALIVSYATKARSAGLKGWTDRRVQVCSFISWLVMLCGGLCVTFAYQSGASVPLMNAIVYSTNLLLNMLFQMYFQLSNYTKTMRCGTLLFALAALQLGDLSPPPAKVDLGSCLQPTAIAWVLAFICLWIASTFIMMRARSLPGTSSVKIVAWALHVACWGSFTDNWAKINGTFDPSSMMYWVLFGPYVPIGMVVGGLEVTAMAATDVALYVPACLCQRLVLNVLSALLVWGEAGRIPSLLPYLVGYMVCVLAVYISTPEMDLVASFKQFQEFRSRGLSQQVAKTAFGKSVLALLEKWAQLAPANGPAAEGAVDAPVPDAAVLKEETKEALQRTLLSGLDGMAFNREQLVDLTLRLWHREGQQYGPCAEGVDWLRGTPYFREYLVRDPSFADVLDSAVSGKGQKVSKDQSAAPADINFQV